MKYLDEFIALIMQFIQFDEEEFKYFSSNFVATCVENGLKEEVANKVLNYIKVKRNELQEA